MSPELQQLADFWNPVVKEIVDNLSAMRDSKGKNRYASGVTGQEISAKNSEFSLITESASELIVTLTFPYYANYIDEGVSGYENQSDATGKYSFKRNGGNIPRQAIRSFMMNRGIVPRNKDGKRTPMKDPEKQLNQIAWLIGRSIKKKGINRFPFISNVLTPELLDRYIELIRTMMGEKIKGQITFEINRADITINTQ